MNTKLRITKPDGETILTNPHLKPGYADRKNKQGEYLYTDKEWSQKIGYQQGILDRMREYGVLEPEIMAVPGRGVDIYRTKRRNDPDLEERLNHARAWANSADIENFNPDWFPDNYVLPSSVYRKQPISLDKLIDWEINEVYAYVIINMNPDPRKEKKNAGLYLERLRELVKEATVTIELPSAAGGKLKLSPGLGFPVLFSADAFINPRPGGVVEFVRYEHWNPIHNPNLRYGGTFKPLEAFAPPVVVDKKKEVVNA